MTTMQDRSDFLEQKVASMLADMRRSGFWQSAIEEARYLSKTYGYVWDVALAKSHRYWCRSPVDLDGDN